MRGFGGLGFFGAEDSGGEGVAEALVGLLVPEGLEEFEGREIGGDKVEGLAAAALGGAEVALLLVVEGAVVEGFGGVGLGWLRGPSLRG